MAKRIKKSIFNFNAVLTEETNGGYSVMVPSLPGCFSQGDTFEEAVENIKEAIELYLEDIKEKEWYRPDKEREFIVPVAVNVRR